MKLRAFVHDRIGYIAVYVAFGLFALGVVHLDLALSGSGISRANLLYIAAVGGVLLLGWLLFDYRRERAFYERLFEAVNAADLSAAGILAEPRTLGQRLCRDAWQRLHSRLLGALSEERERGRRRVHFVTQWAHHMKTPVSVIDLELQKARREGTSPLVESLLEENQRLEHLLQMLLNLNRLDDFGSDLSIEEVDLSALVRRVVNENRRAFIAHRVFPKVEEPADISRRDLVVKSDAKWLRLVLEQLLSNAIKYASRPEENGRVLLRFTRSEGGLLLEVKDDGVGIAPEDLPRVFEPFFTGINGRLNARSTGMGLYLAREICTRLGHRLSLQSARGEGTTAVLHFADDPTLYGGLNELLARK